MDCRLSSQISLPSLFSAAILHFGSVVVPSLSLAFFSCCQVTSHSGVKLEVTAKTFGPSS